MCAGLLFSIKTMQKKQEGVVYLAFGLKYLLLVINSFKTLKQRHPSMPVSIITNIPISDETSGGVFDTIGYFDEIIHINDGDQNNRQYKTQLIKYTPYDRTLFLDADTVVLRDINFGFEFLNRFDFCIKPVGRPKTSSFLESGDVHIDGVDKWEYVHWNSGVFLFTKKDSVRELFQLWNQKYNEFGYGPDQFSLAHSIHYSNVRVYPLKTTWNTSELIEYHPKIIKNIRIHHGILSPDVGIENFESEIPNNLIKPGHIDHSNFEYLKRKIDREIHDARREYTIRKKTKNLKMSPPISYAMKNNFASSAISKIFDSILDKYYGKSTKNNEY